MNFIRQLPLVSKIGLGLFVIALFFLTLNYFSIVKQEIIYSAAKNGSKGGEASPTITPVDTDFGIVVSKIGANTRVIADVDPTDSFVYQRALTHGVAHAKGTAKPGEFGNVFLFAHSSDNFFNANRYNSIFYLLHHMEIGDKFELYFKGQKFEYEVMQKSVVDPSRVDFLSQPTNQKIATLMTCWPAGTTLKRLVLVGRQL